MVATLKLDRGNLDLIGAASGSSDRDRSSENSTKERVACMVKEICSACKHHGPPRHLPPWRIVADINGRAAGALGSAPIMYGISQSVELLSSLSVYARNGSNH